MSELTGAFFEDRGNDRYVATEHARGPWTLEHCHGGPPAALVGRAVEREFGPEFFVSRLTFELLRPIPLGELTLSVGEARGGRRVRRILATLGADGKELMQATALAVSRRDLAIPDEVAAKESPGEPPPPPGNFKAEVFPFFKSAAGYHESMEVRMARGAFGRGRATAWFRPRVPLLEGEAMSALQRVLLAADSGNGVSNILDTQAFGFPNPDLTVNLHRPMVGEWIALQAYTRAHKTGVGMAHSQLWDESGSLGHASQTLLISPVGG